MRNTLMLALLLVAVPMVAQTAPDEHALRRELVQELAKHNVLPREFARIASEGIYHTLAAAVEQELEKTDPCAEVSDRMAWEIFSRTRSFLEKQFESSKAFEQLIFYWTSNFKASEIQELLRFLQTDGGIRTIFGAFSLAANMEKQTTKVLKSELDQLLTELTSPRALAKPAAIETAMRLRRIALGIESYWTDHNGFPPELKHLVPQYLKNLPERDGWGTAFLYILSADGQLYRVVSAGADRKIEPASKDQALFQNPPGEMKLTDDPAADLVWQNGAFLQAPRSLTE
jgi:hypothetical protein